MVRIGVYLVAILHSAVTVSAQIPLKNYSQAQKSTCFRDYVTGLANGFAWANAELARNRSPRIFCVPQGKSLSPDDYLRILDETVARANTAGQNGEIAIENLFLSGLIATFPCEGATVTTPTLPKPNAVSFQPVIASARRIMSDAPFPGMCDGTLTATAETLSWSPAKDECSTDWSSPWTDIQELRFNCSSSAFGGCGIRALAGEKVLSVSARGAAAGLHKLWNLIRDLQLPIREVCTFDGKTPCQ